MAPYTLHTLYTPNGFKVSILLEELGLEYETVSLDLMKGEQRAPAFLEVNPNGRIPALVDNAAGGQRVFESGAILWYLAEKEDKEGRFWPTDFGKRAEVMSWLMFQMGGVGPMQGQANHFVKFSDQKVAYGMKRYVNETKRLYKVMDTQLGKTEYLAGDYSIADMAVFPWVGIAPFSGVDWKAYPNLAAWVQRVYTRPAVRKGMAVPQQSPFMKPLDSAEDYAQFLADANAACSQAQAGAQH